MAKWISLFFDIEPRAKGRPRHSRFGTGCRTPQATLSFENDLKWLCKSQFKREPFDVPLECTMVFTMPKPKKPKFPLPAKTPDLDNLVKSVCDGLNKFVWKDDALIVKIEASKVYTKEAGQQGNILVLVRPIGETHGKENNKEENESRSNHSRGRRKSKKES